MVSSSLLVVPEGRRSTPAANQEGGVGRRAAGGKAVEPGFERGGTEQAAGDAGGDQGEIAGGEGHGDEGEAGEKIWVRACAPAVAPRHMTKLFWELDRLGLVMSQLAALEAERDLALQATRMSKAPSLGTASAGEVGSQLLRLRSIGDCLGVVAGSVLSQLQQPA
jgi:hypothetical protein